MSLEVFGGGKGPAILEGWRRRIFETYAAPTADFLRRGGNRFRNPVADAIRRGTEEVHEARNEEPDPHPPFVPRKTVSDTIFPPAGGSGTASRG